MKIVLAGQLDRVYSNALARAVDDAGDDWRDHTDPTQFENDKRLFHRAGTLAALSDTVVTAPDWYPVDGADQRRRAAPRKDPRFAPGMSLTRGVWVDLYDDAAGLVKVVDFLGSYSERSQAILDEIDAPDAWVDDDSPRSLQRASIGATHAYLTELLLQPFLAWQAGAILVITEADCYLLADVANFLVDGARPRPFPIPDLRATVRPDRTRISGELPDFRIEELADVEARREDPRVQAYAHQLQAIIAAPDLLDVGTCFETARAAALPAGAHLERTEDAITIVVEHPEILSNAGVQVAPRMKTLVRHVQRTFSPQGLSTLVLI